MYLCIYLICICLYVCVCSFMCLSFLKYFAFFHLKTQKNLIFLSSSCWRTSKRHLRQKPEFLKVALQILLNFRFSFVLNCGCLLWGSFEMRNDYLNVANSEGVVSTFTYCEPCFGNKQKKFSL